MSQPKPQAGNMLASSAAGTTFLILIQLASRLVTFASNQLVLRALSPALLGIAAQLELYQVTILYFSRESIRLAIQRQPLSSASLASSAKQSKTLKDANQNTASVASQSVVNVSYLSIFLGVPITIIFTILYQRFAPVQALSTHYFSTSVIITALASFLELSIEPFFAVIQQRMWYEKRAAVEMPSVFLRSFTTCSLFLYASRTSQDLGALPFALGHLGYSLSLFCGYCLTLLPRASDQNLSFILARLQPSSEYFLGLFSRRLTSVATSVFLQSLVKHLLTQGDSMMLAAVSSLEDQGIYSLAANYGGLVARILFQPLEESSRNLFSTLLGPDEGKTQNKTRIRTAKDHLLDILRVYQLLSIFIFPLGPIMVPQILHVLGGDQWSSPHVIRLLALYCCYIPFLAFNGITEAFVASAASTREIQKQTVWMGVFSACYAFAAFLSLKVWSMGAEGLLLANAVNMTVRTLWSYFFIRSYLQKHSNGLHAKELCLRPITYILGATATTLMITKRFPGQDMGIFPATAASGIFAIFV
ncbi:hypothetical protein N7492_004852 [Penicillium capsulatum]|uniref:Man(5)GlcNAc(2)-PP-dolichol translocation protein RFT1 n=1 Tax=Penicillium capsulatum TaxID=69766 RepID=A0A9W9I8E5_9EURO|nr:hypothetical protein N7492_004852 [Penicillium capsulatum]KAJ6136039.1 hypothetical protein N7512_001199 [Penicillium capsulatum]